MSDRPRHTQIAAALIRRGEEILLVQQQGPDDPEPSWSLPGGVVEPGELPHEAMFREVREETGLEVLAPGCLLYVKSSADPSGDSPGTTFVFETSEWIGELKPVDPDEAILQARFVSLEDAIEKLHSLQWIMMREPIIAHLQGEVAAGALWLYHHFPDRSAELVGRVAKESRDSAGV